MGFLPIDRELFKGPLWKQKRVFSWFEAYLDLVQLARFEKELKTELIDNRLITFGYGQLAASVRFLQIRWNWGSTKTVHKFLKKLENGNAIKLNKETGQNVITICNYGTYTEKNNEGKRRGNAKGNGKETEGKRRGNETNNVNKDNKENKYTFPEFLEFLSNLKGKKFKPVEKTEKQFNARLNEYTKDEIITACINCFNDAYHIENPKYLTPEFITRPDKMQMYLNAENPNPKSENKKEVSKPAAAPKNIAEQIKNQKNNNYA